MVIGAALDEDLFDMLNLSSNERCPDWQHRKAKDAAPKKLLRVWSKFFGFYGNACESLSPP
jgi:hypothetical protein